MGLMIIAQHPDAICKDYVSTLNFGSNTKIGLFTTYKIATGSMFSRMILLRPEFPGLRRTKVENEFKGV